MIRPKPKGRQLGPRLGAWALTIAFLLGAAASLKATSLPRLMSGREMIRELDALMLERFAFAQPEEATVEEEIPEAMEDIVDEVSFDDEVGAAVAGLEDLFGDEVTPTVAARDPGTGSDLTTGIAATADDARFESLFGARGDSPTGRIGRDRRTSARGGAGGLGIGINERLAEPDPDSPTSPAAVAEGPDVAVQTGMEREEVEAPTVEINEYEAESFDGSEAARLGAWMRSNPAALPVGVQVHMNYESTFLTSVISFDSGGDRWELYLMLNEALRELHIVLVQGDRSVYLIDRGFQAQSRSLREGTVRRAGGRIMAVDSRSGSASGDRASEFYNVFLSWWETTKSDAAS